MGLRGLLKMTRKGDRSTFSISGEGPCKPGICGKEAACRHQHDVDRFECICPHDSSPPTQDMRCPVRKTVSMRPQPISHIIPPTGNPSLLAPFFNSTSPPPQLPRALLSSGLILGGPGIIVASTTSIVIVFIVISLVCWKRRALANFLRSDANRKAASCSPSPRSLSKSVLVPDRYAGNPQYSVSEMLPDPPLPPPICSVPIITRTNLKLQKDLGEGCFGKVYRGELGSSNGEIQQVAIKVLKKCASREAEDDFMREVEIMSGFKHANILTLLGIVQRDDGGEPWMVFEFMAHGDLAEVLRANSKQLWRPLPGLPSLGAAALHSVALQIASGMQYLAGQHFVHRDLACRNCLVGAGLVVKIADFGMSRDVYTCDYYKIGGSRMLPVRWMSPESVTYGRFTLESDVWSYGVVLWEIFSLGKQPYYGHSNEEVVELILQGIMLIPPEKCPSYVCDLMRFCWKTDPRDRIKFTDICNRLVKAPIPVPPCSPLDTTLPLPPNEINIDSAAGVELLDADSYLLPIRAAPAEYLETLPV